MESIPQELVEEILGYCVASNPKNAVTPLRLVCKAFDRALKPFVCKTLDLDFTRLSKGTARPPPQLEALETIGHHCKNIYIDLMVLRDETEVEFLEQIFAGADIMLDFCSSLKENYCMRPSSFTTWDYYAVLEAILLSCRNIEALRLNLPFQIIGRHTNAATLILANTFKAIAKRPLEDSAPLRTLVLESASDVAICSLWMNPIDVQNILTATAKLKNLVITLRRQEDDVLRIQFFGNCFWSVIESAEGLESLCLIGLEMDERPPRTFRRTYSSRVLFRNWYFRAMPDPHILLSSLTRLELKRVEIQGDFLIHVAENCNALEELYLNEIYLKTQDIRDPSETRSYLWVGLPGLRPSALDTWLAMEVRLAARRLRICRASFLAYDHYTWGHMRDFEDDETAGLPPFDLYDPCGLSRTISQRFVEVVMGLEQPHTLRGEPVMYLPRKERHDALVGKLKPRSRPFSITEHDTNAHQLAYGNTTSEWQKSIDGIWPNCNQGTLDELHRIAETAYRGLHEAHEQQREIVDDGDQVPGDMPPPGTAPTVPGQASNNQDPAQDHDLAPE